MKRLSFVMMFVCSMLWSYGQVIDSETETTKEGQTTVMEPRRAPIDGTYKKIVCRVLRGKSAKECTKGARSAFAEASA